MFLLPNGKQIDSEELFGLLGGRERSGERFLDLDTGVVASAGGPRRLLVPRVSAERKLAWMLEFVGDQTDDQTEYPASALLRAMADTPPDKALAACERILETGQHLPEEDGGGWIHAWLMVFADRLDDAVRDWLESSGTGAIEREEFCAEGCCLCRALQYDEDRRVANILSASAVARGETSPELTSPKRWRESWYPDGLPPEPTPPLTDWEEER